MSATPTTPVIVGGGEFAPSLSDTLSFSLMAAIYSVTIIMFATWFWQRRANRQKNEQNARIRLQKKSEQTKAEPKLMNDPEWGALERVRNTLTTALQTTSAALQVVRFEVEQERQRTLRQSEGRRRTIRNLFRKSVPPRETTGNVPTRVVVASADSTPAGSSVLESIVEDETVSSRPVTHQVFLSAAHKVVVAARVAVLSAHEAFVLVTKDQKITPHDSAAMLQSPIDILAGVAVTLERRVTMDKEPNARTRDLSLNTTRPQTTGTLEAQRVAIATAVSQLPHDVWGWQQRTSIARVTGHSAPSREDGTRNFVSVVENRVEMVYRNVESKSVMDLVTELEHKMAKHVPLFEREQVHLDVVSDDNVVVKRMQRRRFHRFMIWLGLPVAIRHYPAFYTVLFALYVSIFLTFALKAPVANNRGIETGGYFGSFLPVPPQYDVANVSIQRYLLPLIYGVMHTALFSLGLLPVTMCRGMHRDLMNWSPNVLSAWVPLDDMTWLHMVLGVWALAAVVVAATIWIIMMSLSCYGHASDNVEAQRRACLAFNPDIVDTIANDVFYFDSIKGASYFDPRDNVVFLRILVWFIWLFGLPLVVLGTKEPPKFLPTFMQRLWWEICFYIHFSGAWITVLTAYYARFEVFYPTIAGWALLAVEYMRERAFHEHRTRFLVNPTLEKSTNVNPLPTTIFVDEKSNRPTTMRFLFPRSVHYTSEMISKSPRTFHAAAGQWVYVRCPAINRVWHPFSLASASQDSQLKLYVGIRGNKDVWIPPEEPNEPWQMHRRLKTWTYCLLEKLQDKAQQLTENPGAELKIPVQIRGPYGSPFTGCISDRYTSSVLIGAGTGLSSALSVLQEMLTRKARREPVPQLVWFVWSCRSEKQLDWCWSALQEIVFNAWKAGALEIDENWSPYTSNMFDWLGITVYVSQTSEERLQSHLNTHRQVRGLKKPQPTRSRWGNVKSKSLGPGSHRGVFARRKSSGATRQPSLGALGSMLVTSTVDKTFQTRRTETGSNDLGGVAGILEHLKRASKSDSAPGEFPQRRPATLSSQPTTPSPISGQQNTSGQQKVSEMPRTPDPTQHRQYTEKQLRMHKARAERAQRSTHAAQQLAKQVRSPETDTNLPRRDIGRGVSFHADTYHRNNRRSTKQRSDSKSPQSHTKPHNSSSGSTNGSSDSGTTADTNSSGHGGNASSSGNDDGYMEVRAEKPQLVLSGDDLDDAIVQETLLTTLQQRKEQRMKAHVALWLEEQAIPAAMDDKCVPVMNLLQWVHETELHSTTGARASNGRSAADCAGDGDDATPTMGPRTQQHRSRKTCVCFCGPAALGRMLHEGVYNLNYDIAFYSETQAN